MYNKFKKQIFCLSTFLLIFLVSCTTIPVQPPANNFSAYTVRDDQIILNRYAPVFVVENDQMKYNRIGTPTAEINEDGKEKIYIDSDKATIYAEVRQFKTLKSTYTNPKTSVFSKMKS